MSSQQTRSDDDGRRRRFQSTTESALFPLMRTSAAADAKAKENPKPPTKITTRRRSAPDAGFFEPSLSNSGSAARSARASDPGGRRSLRPAIFDKYKPVKMIGKGQCGTVFAVETRTKDSARLPMIAARNQRPESGSLYACKIIDIAKPSENPGKDKELLDDVLKEIDAMKGSKHPNVQDLIEYSVESDKVYIVSSLCRGGDLAQALELRGCLCEEDAKTVMAGILRGVSHLHSRGVVHRDLKLENILLANCSHDMSKVKIIDMGFAKKLSSAGATSTEGEAMHSVCGTALYFAPEVVKPSLSAGELRHKARFGTKVDMWSCGVILYCLLSGCPPFQVSKTNALWQLFEDISSATYDFADPVWELLSDDALGMVEGLLKADPAKRMSAEEALQHPWMAGC